MLSLKRFPIEVLCLDPALTNLYTLFKKISGHYNHKKLITKMSSSSSNPKGSAPKKKRVKRPIIIDAEEGTILP